MSEDDIVNTLVELAQLEMTVPALLETGAGIVVRRLEKMKEGKVSELARELVIRSDGRELPSNMSHLSTMWRHSFNSN